MSDYIKRIEVTVQQILIYYEGSKANKALSRHDHDIKVTGEGIVVISISKGSKPKLLVSVHKIDYIEFND